MCKGRFDDRSPTGLVTDSSATSADCDKNHAVQCQDVPHSHGYLTRRGPLGHSTTIQRSRASNIRNMLNALIEVLQETTRQPCCRDHMGHIQLMSITRTILCTKPKSRAVLCNTLSPNTEALVAIPIPIPDLNTEYSTKSSGCGPWEAAVQDDHFRGFFFRSITRYVSVARRSGHDFRQGAHKSYPKLKLQNFDSQDLQKTLMREHRAQREC